MIRNAVKSVRSRIISFAYTGLVPTLPYVHSVLLEVNTSYTVQHKSNQEVFSKAVYTLVHQEPVLVELH